MNESEKHTLEEFKADFKELKDKGWVTSNRFHDTGIGKTCEDLLKIAENNKSSADYKDLIEIKSARELSEAMLTLFTKSPEPKGVNDKIKDTFGYPDEEFPNINILHTTFSALYFNNCKDKYGFKLIIDDKQQKVFIITKNLISGKIDDRIEAYYSFSDLEKKVKSKCKYIAFILTENKRENGKELFNFKKVFLLSGLTFIKFLDDIRKGLIKYDFRIGIFRNPKNQKLKGKKHDHGSGFRIIKEDMNKVFQVEEID